MGPYRPGGVVPGEGCLRARDATTQRDRHREACGRPAGKCVASGPMHDARVDLAPRDAINPEAQITHNSIPQLKLARIGE